MVVAGGYHTLSTAEFAYTRIMRCRKTGEGCLRELSNSHKPCRQLPRFKNISEVEKSRSLHYSIHHIWCNRSDLFVFAVSHGRSEKKKINTRTGILTTTRSVGRTNGQAIATTASNRSDEHRHANSLVSSLAADPAGKECRVVRNDRTLIPTPVLSTASCNSDPRNDLSSRSRW